MRNFFKHITLIACIVVLSALSAESTPVPGTDINFDSPAGWDVKSGQAGTLIMIMAPVKGGFSANINVIKEFVGDIEMDEYMRLSQKNLSKAIDKYKLLDETTANINGRPFRAIEYTGKYNKQSLHWVQLFTIYQNTAYIFTGTMLDKYSDEYMAVIIDSFKTIRFGGSPENYGSTAPPPYTGPSGHSDK